MNLKKKELFLFDLDGVVYLGNEPIPGAKEVVETLRKKNKRVYFLTNNSTRTRAKFRDKLIRMGIQAREAQIVTSAYATAQYLQQRSGSIVYVVGEEGLVNEFKAAGFQVFTGESSSDVIDYVVVGLDSYFNYQKLTNAMRAIDNGAKFIATNNDPTLPTERGNLPGAGTMVSALTAAVYHEPMITIGKPNPFMVNLILKLENKMPSTAVIIGDRYITDIRAGMNAQIGTILVKTGTGQQELAKITTSDPKPDLILESIADLLQYL